jgi:hypothetical protein
MKLRQLDARTVEVTVACSDHFSPLCTTPKNLERRWHKRPSEQDAGFGAQPRQVVGRLL